MHEKIVDEKFNFSAVKMSESSIFSRSMPPHKFPIADLELLFRAVTQHSLLHQVRAFLQLRPVQRFAYFGGRNVRQIFVAPGRQLGYDQILQ